MADNQSQQENNKSGLVSRGINAANRAQSAAKWGKRIQQGAQIVEEFGEVMGTAPAWIVPATIGVVCVAVLIIIFGVITPSTTVGGNLTSPGPSGILSSNSPGPTSSGSPVSTTAIANYINTPGASASERQTILNMFSLPFQSPKYASLLTSSGPINIYFYQDSSLGNQILGGANYDQDTMKFWNFFGSGVSYQMKQHILIHESIHIIQKRNGMLGFDLNSLIQQDPNCYDNGWLKTYAFRDSNYPNPVTYDAKAHEAMAEAGANNAMCVPGTLCDFNKIYYSTAINYPVACKNTYEWIRTNIYGGVDFFGLP